MKISGFSFVRNAISLYYPITEAIKSVLSICDEFVIAVGESDDKTREEIAQINSSKIKIIDTVWDKKYFKGGIINALQTDIAKNECSGEWLFYLQADEVVHEKYLPIIKNRCEELLNNEEVEGLLFRYKHFWGDYEHCHSGHGWYPNEIRIIRNRSDIHSFESAQSFRKFDYYENPRQPHGHSKLNVAKVDAEIYHYGWVRPPHLMNNKMLALHTLHKGEKRAKEVMKNISVEFDYGPLNLLSKFDGTHPEVMRKMIEQMNWEDKLQYQGKPNSYRQPHKHERAKYRILSIIEKTFLSGKQIGGFKNYKLLKNV